jgi:flagellar capping protein FliD
MAETARTEKSSSTAARISVLENQVVTVSNNIEKLEAKVEDQYKTLHSRISDLRDDVRSDIEVKHDKLVYKIDEHSVASSIKLDHIENKISAIEKWRWTFMGAAIVVGYVLAHIKIDRLF